MRKYTRNRKDTKGSQNAYYNACLFILLLVKNRLGIFPFFNNLFTLFMNMKTKDKTVHIQIKDLNSFKIAILLEKFY